MTSGNPQRGAAVEVHLGEAEVGERGPAEVPEGGVHVGPAGPDGFQQ